MAKEILPLVENPVDGVDNSLNGAESGQPVNYEDLYRQASQSIAELTAERDSLLSENTELRNARDAAMTESAKTKELNYTLARQLDVAQTANRQPEAILADMFLKK